DRRLAVLRAQLVPAHAPVPAPRRRGAARRAGVVALRLPARPPDLSALHRVPAGLLAAAAAAPDAADVGAGGVRPPGRAPRVLAHLVDRGRAQVLPGAAADGAAVRPRGAPQLLGGHRDGGGGGGHAGLAGSALP